MTLSSDKYFVFFCAFHQNPHALNMVLFIDITVMIDFSWDKEVEVHILANEKADDIRDEETHTS